MALKDMEGSGQHRHQATKEGDLADQYDALAKKDVIFLLKGIRNFKERASTTNRFARCRHHSERL